MSKSKEPRIGWSDALGEHIANPSTPSQGSYVLTVDGVSWNVSDVENRLKGQVERYVRRLAEREAEQLGRIYMSIYLQDRAAGHYSWPEDDVMDEVGMAIRTFLATANGVRLVLFALIKRCHPEVTETDVDRMLDKEPALCVDVVRRALGNVGPSTKKASVVEGEGEKAQDAAA